MKDPKTILQILEHKVAQHSNPVWHQWIAILIRDTIIKVSLFVLYGRKTGETRDPRTGPVGVSTVVPGHYRL